MTLDELTNGEPFDAVIIGGGINGCGIAEEAAARGLRVALFEATDFGFGTTWRSTKLIHGGLRYLEHGDVRLVRESLRERSWLLQTRPYLVTPQRLFLPMLPWTRRPGWQLRIGLAAYDLLALYRGVPKHRALRREKLRELAPYLPGSAGGGFSFYDARIHAPERLALELALEARRLGAVIANHTRVVSVTSDGKRVTGVVVEAEGEAHAIPTRAVINAAGPWVDAVNEHGGLPGVELLGLTRGTHIVFEPEQPLGRDAVFSNTKRDGRVFFAVPQGPLLLVGTTDDRFDGDPSSIRPSSCDVDYLLEEAQELLPGMGLTRDRIRYAYAGLRPLQRVKGGPEAAISRRHAVVPHAKHGGPEGMYSVVGGKLSTFRPLAEEAAALLGPPRKRKTDNSPVAPRWNLVLKETPLSLHQKHHLRIYGPAIAEVLALGMEPLCEHAGAIAGEVRYVATTEEVKSLADIMMRRTGISWSACRGLCCAETVAAIAGTVLGWDGARQSAELDAFRAELDFHLPSVESLGLGMA
ncbi:MAG: glycerol-3-phosphate dehydrogenase/oxidase [Dehalococcoidia bacterium]|nr:glycerol-3-phosphate dehydrogenase/oxidase [Dehalococcoidia bacterium]